MTEELGPIRESESHNIYNPKRVEFEGFVGVYNSYFLKEQAVKNHAF